MIHLCVRGGTIAPKGTEGYGMIHLCVRKCFLEGGDVIRNVAVSTIAQDNIHRVVIDGELGSITNTEVDVEELVGVLVVVVGSSHGLGDLVSVNINTNDTVGGTDNLRGEETVVTETTTQVSNDDGTCSRGGCSSGTLVDQVTFNLGQRFTSAHDFDDDIITEEFKIFLGVAEFQGKFSGNFDLRHICILFNNKYYLENKKRERKRKH